MKLSSRILKKKCNSRFCLSLLLVVVLFIMVFQTTWASAPLVKSQAPGYYRMMVGDFEVTALYDGKGAMGIDVLTNIKPQTASGILEKQFLSGKNLTINGIAYLINTGEQLILVDAGAGRFWPGLGRVIDSMKASGYSPEQVDLVLMTHLHADHVGGLLTVDGQRAFPNAEVRMAQAESDYWLSDTNQKRAPELIREMFPIARAAASLYQAEGRWKPFSDFGEVTPGVKAIPLTGHTAGHTGFQITSQGKTLLIWGDLVHSSAVETANANVGFAFDTDGKLAIANRQKLFAKVAKEGLLVAGMHMPFPGIGHLQKIGRSYRWIPVEYSSGLD